MLAASLCFCVLLLLGACSGDSPPPAEGGGAAAPGVVAEPALAAREPIFAPELNVDLGAMERAPSGLYYRDLVVGEGPEAEAAAMMEVHYTAWLADGTRVASTRDSGVAAMFLLGAGEVFPALDEALDGMHAGGRRQIVAPAALTYGAQGLAGAVPADATVVLEVELVRVDAF